MARSAWGAILVRMTFIWFVVWFIANITGANEPLLTNPVNGWTGTLLLAIALDLARQHAPTRDH